MSSQQAGKTGPKMQTISLKNGDKLLFEILGKITKVFYNDTANTVSFKEGKFFDFDSFNLMVIENSNSRPTIIPRGKCIRIELGGEEIVKAKTGHTQAGTQRNVKQIIKGGAEIATPAR